MTLRYCSGRCRRRQRSASPDSGSGDNNLIVDGKRVRRPIPRQEWSDSEDEDPYNTDDTDDWNSDIPSIESQDSGLHSQSLDF